MADALTPEVKAALAEDLAAFTNDPYGFVLWAFPWGEGELADASGPEWWQAEALIYLRDQLRAGVPLENGLTSVIVRVAISSGHGIGKSALFCWLMLWASSTAPVRGVVTANTETQLRTKTWAELAKWHRLCLAKDLLAYTATKLAITDPVHADTWRIDMVPWSANNPAAFAGLHNKGYRVILFFDEASAIDPIIWETAEGALTDMNTQILWIVAGNPTESSGRFMECFGKFAARWKTFKVDARTVRLTNHKQHKEWLDDWGEDSDFFRVRVRGEFPTVSFSEFIDRARVERAQTNAIDILPTDPVILGVDVARYGKNFSVIYPRQGRDARTRKYRLFMSISTMMLADEIARAYREEEADIIFVDEGGVGGGVVDRCIQLGLPVIGINFGAKASRGLAGGARYSNKRTEMWGNMRNWLERGCLPADEQLANELTGPLYGFNNQQEMQLEKKEDMEARGIPSPDRADALALTFALPVEPRMSIYRAPNRVVGVDYDPWRAGAW